MPKTRLSAIAIEKLAPPQSGRIEVHDSEVPGLVLRVSSSGVKSFSLTYRFRGVLRRLTLGQWSPSGLSLKEARERAREARGAIQRGSDPVEERKEEERERATTAFSVLVNDFVEKWCKPRQRTWKKTEAILKRLAVSEFGDRPVRDITRRDIANLLDRVASGTPYQSNILRAWLSKFWNWCLEAEYAEVNPVAGVSPRIKPQARSRVLTNAEVVALWKAAQKVGGAFGDATRLLLLTGMRRDEVSFLRWDELDLGVGWANLPASRMKAGRNFRAPLSPAAKIIVESRPRLCEFVFTTNGRSAIQGWNRWKEALDREMALILKQSIPDFRIHDLRRTCASGLASLSYGTETIKRLLGHAPPKSDVTWVYNRHSYDDEAREAVTRWAAHIARLVSGLEVVPSQPAA